jgi:3-oxoacyl-[acyl-carrier protein] reductase
VDLGLKGRVAIVAAASKGLGRAVATELAREGAEVAICSRSEKNLADAAARIRSETGREVFSRALDVSDAAAAGAFVEGAEAKFGRVNICVTNSGGPAAKKFLDIAPDEWRASIDDLLMSTIYFAREVLPRMQKNRWGRLITITSVAVKQPVNGLIMSTSVRAGVTGLARTLANEFGAYGITVNNVCPGFTRTERLEELAEFHAKAGGKSREEIFAAWAAGSPSGRLGEPQELAALVTFLASERAAYINGTSIAVDGGTVQSLL